MLEKAQMGPLVSVVVITYNSVLYVEETLNSIYNQTYDEIELIISDDGSIDNTVGLCKEWIQNHKYRFSRVEIISAEVNSGISSNCNRGLYSSKGEWVKFIAGDDVLEPVTIEKYVLFCNSNPKAKCLFSGLKEYNESFDERNLILPVIDASKFEICQPNINSSDQFKILLRSNEVWAVTLYLNAEKLKKMGGFDERYQFFEDRPLLLKLTNSGCKIYYLDFFGAKYRRHLDSVQNNNNLFRSNFQLSQQKFFFENYSNHFDKSERVLIELRYFKDRCLIRIFNNKLNISVRLIDSFLERVLFYPLKWFIKSKTR